MSDPVIKATTATESKSDAEVYLTRWEGLTITKPEGEALRVKALQTRMFQVIGEFGGAAILLMASLNGTDWAQVASFDEAGMYALKEDYQFVKPRLYQATNATKVTVMFLQRRQS